MKGHLFFVGIAGHAMRGLALAARDNDYLVTGLDPSAIPPGSDWLDEQGFAWARTFEPAQLDGVTAVIITGAHVSEDAPVIVEARRRQIEITSYAELFGDLTKNAHVIAVAGTHGKTTTTALIAWLFESAGRHPDFLIGIQPFNFSSSVRIGGSNIAVVEGDEYKASPLDSKSKVQYYHPDTLVLTSVEHDHPDMYPSLEAVKRRFQEIVSAVPRTGHLIVCAEHQDVLEIAKSADCPVTTYGLQTGDYQPTGVTYTPAGIEFEVMRRGTSVGRIVTALYGQHNVLNVLAGVAVALEHGLSFEQISQGAASFKGAYRRFNIISSSGAPITVVDDYAHHPTEVATNVEAAKLHFQGHRVIVIFRPHTYSRTAALLTEFQAAFKQADVVIITDIEGAREAEHVLKVSGKDIVDALTMPASYQPDRAGLISYVKDVAKPGDVILALSVSGHQSMAQELAKVLNPAM